MPTREDSLSWATPEWWVRPNRGFREISRDRFIKLWTDAMARPKPNISLLRDETKGWISDLGHRAWIEQLYTKACAAALWSDTTVLRYDVEVWNNATEAFADYVDPLIRISSSYQQSAKDQRPMGLPAALNDTLRQLYLSDTCGAARRALILSDDCGQITTTKASADQFLAEPTRAGDQVYAAAMRGFASGLVKWVDNLEESPKESPGPDILEILYSKIDYLSETYGEPDALLRKPTQEEIDIVEAELNRVIMDNPALVRRKGKMLSGFTSSVATEDDVVGDAWVRARKYLLKNLIEGDPLQPEKTFLLKLKWTIFDLRRRELRIIDRAEWVAESSDSENLSSTMESSSDTHSYRVENDRVELRTVFAKAASYLEDSSVGEMYARQDPDVVDRVCWERRTAIEFLRAGATNTAPLTLDAASITKLIVALREIDTPTDAVKSSPAASAKMVVQLLRIGIAGVLTIGDIRSGDVQFGKPFNQTWSQRTNVLTRKLAHSHDALTRTESK